MSRNCARPGCTEPAETRGYCESDYRRRIRMGMHGYQDAGEAREHVRHLRDLGWTWNQIADAAGLSNWVAFKLHDGTTRRLIPESLTALLSVPLTPQNSHRGVDSTGTRRRVQALAWMGWPCSEVARRAGTTRRTLATLILPQRRISYALAHRVADVYDQLSMTPGPSAGAAAKARQLGFAPPLAWDDEDIDNPQAMPHTTSDQAGGGRRRKLPPVDDLHWLLESGHSVHTIADRYGVPTGTVERALARGEAAA